MTTTGPEDQDLRDEALLDPFFAAARADDPPMPLPLLAAILGDAAAVAASRLPAEAPPPPAHFPLPRDWRIAGALAAAAVLGFWVGVVGTVEVTAPIGLSLAAAEVEDPTDPVAGFFDLASVEP